MERFKALPKKKRLEFIRSLSEKEAQDFEYNWSIWARPNQLLPPENAILGGWATWLIKAGRGFGKTRVGAETVRQWVKDYPIVNIAGPTASDARDVMVQGPSGILAVCPRHERPEYIKGERLLRWPNGATSLVFSADEPERFRGPQCYKFWADELAAWRYADEAWDNAMFGLRLGDNPQAVVTTTPKPTKLVRALLKDPDTFVTNGTTYDNRSNLSDKFFRKIISKYEGTRLGRQEINAELLEDNPGALWTHELIENARWNQKIPDLVRIVVGVDPAVTSNEDSDETGIVIVGRDRQRIPHFYVIDDVSFIGSPGEWAATVVDAYKTQGADRVVAEVNNGGDLVEAILRTKDLSFAYKSVHASRGKVTRAEPIAALYEQGRVHHVGTLGKLEDQMCDFNAQTSTKSPDRMDALVWALWELNDANFQHGLISSWEEDAKKVATPKQWTREELSAQPQSQKDEMFGRTVTPKSLGKVVTADQQTDKCPKCDNAFPSKFGETMRCGSCGHNWQAKSE